MYMTKLYSYHHDISMEWINNEYEFIVDCMYGHYIKNLIYFPISFAQCSLIVLASPWLINKSSRANQVGPEILAY